MSSQVHGPRPRVLLAEAEPSLAACYEDALTESGFEVVAFGTTVEEASTLACAMQVDAAVLDVTLRGEPVFEAARPLVERGIPILFVTAGQGCCPPAGMTDAPVINPAGRPAQVGTRLRELLR